MSITHERLTEVLYYDPSTGIFRWKVRNSNVVRVGDEAGGCGGVGYIYIGVDGKRLLAHRLAWLYVHGQHPQGIIDHIDGDKTNNRIANLRLATYSQNGANSRSRTNNTSGHKGVWWNQRNKRWRAHIGVERRWIDLGSFVNKDDAVAAYRAAAKAYFGDFARET